MRLIPYEDLYPAKGINKSRSQINRDVKAGKFPRPVRQGRSPLWVEAELDAHIRRLIAERDGEQMPEAAA